MSEVLDAFRLPGTTLPEEMETRETGRLTLRYPAPTPDAIEEVARTLRVAGRRLAERPVREIVAGIDAAAARLTDSGSPLRQRAERLVAAAAGYSPEQTRLVLDRMAGEWRAPELLELLRAELGDPDALDRFVDVGPGRRARAYGPGLSFHVFAGNVPGVAVTSMIRSLLVKSPVLGKLAAGEPVLPVLFADALASVDAELAAALAVTYWPGGAVDAERQACAAADLVVIYGGDAAVASLRERIPEGRRLVVHGPRFSVGLISASALRDGFDAPARRVAEAVAAFDQHGCVSPHAVWVQDQTGDVAAPFAEAVARALAAAEREMPRGEVTTAEAAAIQQERGAAEMRGHAGGGVRVLASDGTRWTVVLDTDPTFRPSCLNRFLYLHPVSDLGDVIDILAPVGAHLQSVALEATAPERERLADRLARIGATRVTTFERLPWPPPAWHHDGASPLRELLRWVDLEG